MRGVWTIGVLALACAHAPALPGFRGPGRLLLILEREAGAELLVLDGAGAQRTAVDAPREARFLGPDALVVVADAPAAEEYGPPDTQVWLVDLTDGDTRAIGAPGRHHDAEPSPDGRWLAIGVEAAGVGDSDLEIWSIPDGARVASRAQSLEEPRWRHDGRALVASVLMADPETDDDTGGGMLGTSFSWPRLHRLGRDLGEPRLLWDGADSRSLAPGGSLPLWWDEAGIFARQRGGLVRCDAGAGGCVLVYAAEPMRRVVDGRRVGEREAWLLTLPARDAFDRSQPDEIVRVDLETGGALSRWSAPEGVAVTEIDWIASP